MQNFLFYRKSDRHTGMPITVRRILENVDHVPVTTRPCERARRHALAMGNCVCAGRHERREGFRVAWSALSQYYRFDEGGPPEIVHVIEGDSRLDESSPPRVPEVRGRDEGSAVVPARHEFRAGAKIDQHAQRGHAVGDRRDCHRIVGIAFLRTEIAPALASTAITS